MIPHNEISEAPSGSRLVKPKRTRGRSHAQESAARRRRYVSSFVVEDFNQAEAQRERHDLLVRIGAIIDDVEYFAAELPLVCLMVAIAGYVDWYLISGHPVEVSKYTAERAPGTVRARRCMTAVVMDHIRTW